MMQAIIVTLCFRHFSHSIISMLNTRFDSPVIGRWAALLAMTSPLHDKADYLLVVRLVIFFFIGKFRAVFTSSRCGDLRTKIAIRREYAKLAGNPKRVRLSLGGGMSAANLPIKSMGSKTTLSRRSPVVPSRYGVFNS